PNVNYMPRSGDNSDVPFYSLNGPHFAPLPQDPSVSTTHLNPKFKGFWRPMTPLGSGQRIQPLVPGKSFKQRSSTADDQAKGMFMNFFLKKKSLFIVEECEKNKVCFTNSV
ncbi:hypothetical protein P7M41_26905, partial [Vibrio parahaemolyticus]|nr:hypothetical protein [Vibrio parahaemolyticus]